MSKLSRNLAATETRACSGQGRNQSMVVPLMSPGNCSALCITEEVTTS